MRPGDSLGLGGSQASSNANRRGSTGNIGIGGDAGGAVGDFWRWGILIGIEGDVKKGDVKIMGIGDFVGVEC